MSLTIIILGCGSSGGVPRLGNDWGSCNPDEPKNRRRRSSIMVEKQKSPSEITRVLIDTSPDLREQLLDANVSRVDGVLLTHDHADQTHGIDDLRPAVYNAGKQADIYMNQETCHVMSQRFGYIFKTPDGSPYPPIAKSHIIKAFDTVSIEGAGGLIEVTVFEQKHGHIKTLGFRIGDFAYSNDLDELSEASASLLEGLDLWIVDALRYKPHPTHFSVDEALEWIDRLKPKRAVLTNMHTDLDYETLRAELPEGVEPAFDGMKLAC